MRNTDRLKAAKQSLVAGVTRSYEAKHEYDDEGRATQTHVFGADLRLRRGGRHDLAQRVAAVLEEDVTTTEARAEMREIAQLIDAELAPDVSLDSFKPASDGGERL